jgi:hypothetical protein
LTGIGAYTGKDGSTLALAGFDTTMGSLVGTGSVTLGTATLSVGGDNAPPALQEAFRAAAAWPRRGPER